MMSDEVPQKESPVAPGQKIDVVSFYFQNTWGEYGYEFEQIQKRIAEFDSVGRVVCVFPPRKARYGVPFVYQRISGKLSLLTPNDRILPLSRFRGTRVCNRAMVSVSLKWFFAANRWKMDNTVLWLYPPDRFISTLRTVVPHRFIVTQLVDNNTFLSNVGSDEISFYDRQYEDLSRTADVLITSSRLNYDLFSRVNPNCYLFENALDEIFLSPPERQPYRVHEARPRLAYVGFISQRTDIALLEYIARRRPQYDLVIAGPQEEGSDMRSVLDLPNVRYEGVIRYDDLPAFLRTVDVCLIPHRDTPYSRSMSPLKVFQYLGSGRPVVSTRIAGVERWSEHIAIADEYEAFVKEIDSAVHNDSEQRSRTRIEAVKTETWETRVNEMFGAIAKHLRVCRR